MLKILRMNRLQREALIVKTMIEYHCEIVHSEGKTCEHCKILIDYTSRKLERCRFGSTKPVCKDCPVHCYSPEMKQKIREVMCWAGPKMIFRYPLYAMIHIYDTQLNKPRTAYENNIS